jgi:hypothetical protein
MLPVTSPALQMPQMSFLSVSVLDREASQRGGHLNVGP